MAILTATMRTKLATAYATNATYAALSTTAPGATAGTEVTGGSPAYARVAMASLWATAASSAVTVTGPVVFNVPPSTTVVGFEFYDAATAGNYLDGCGITSQNFASQGTYSITPTYTQS